MANEEVYDFFKKNIRPFSINDVSQNVDQEFGKAAVQKALDKLVSQKKILEKSYGKQKVYCLSQEGDGDPNQINEEILTINRQINDVESKLKETAEKLDVVNNTEKTLAKQLTLEEAKKEKEKLITEIDELKGKLEGHKGCKVQISEGDKKKIHAEYERYVKEYRKRKRICLDMVSGILDGYPKTKKHLLEEVGVETDEDVGFVLKQN